MPHSVSKFDTTNPVVVQCHAHWSSGQSTMDIEIQFTAPSLEEALRKIKYATPDGAPLFQTPEEE